MTLGKSQFVPAGWMPLTLLSARFNANVQALAGRDQALADRVRSFRPTEPYYIRSAEDRLELAVGQGDSFRVLPTRLSPAAATGVMRSLCPAGKVTDAVLVAGEDQGWLWNAICQLPAESPHANGHRPPVYFLTADLERFRVLLHLHDWRTMLSDRRVRLFVGPDCAAELGHSLVTELMLPWPVASVTIEPAVWPDGQSLQAVVDAARTQQSRQLNQLAATDPASAAAIVDRITAGRPLRVLGITSRFTTFIQHSMRDWLAAFESLGHTTRLLIESADHEIPSNLVTATTCDEFRPDLVVAIDHSRRTLSGVPAHVPVVMWVQDKLPNIYNPAAGAALGLLDFVIGYGRLELTTNFNYPPSRFMPTMMATNETRFTSTRRPYAELARFRCDVSYVSHASTPPDQIIARTKAALPQPEAKALIDDLYGKVKSVYDAGGGISSGDDIHSIIRVTLAERKLAADEAGLFDLFAHQVNNALFRQQALAWVAELGVDLRLYGRGWETHPTLSKHARGEADNAVDLHAIYQASAINLQVTPFGAVHQRLLDGLASGGFFLMRSVTADELDLLRKRMWDWCVAREISSGPEMFARRDPEWSAAAERYAALGATHPRTDPAGVYAEMEECALTGFSRTPETLFENTAAVTFSTRDQLQAGVKRYLAAPDERAAVAAAMRGRVIQAHTYRGITSRMLRFVQSGLSGVTADGRAAA
jgi:hypothetical protein